MSTTDANASTMSASPSELLFGDHTYCDWCQGKYSSPPTLTDVKGQPEPFTTEMKKYVEYWEANRSTIPRNPSTKRSIKRHGRVYRKCLSAYEKYKLLENPERWRQRELEKLCTEYESRKKSAENYCKYLHKSRTAELLFDRLPGSKFICKICKGKASVDEHRFECHLCRDWYYPNNCGCESSLTVSCKQCKTGVEYTDNHYMTREDNITHVSQVWYSEELNISGQ